MSWLRSKGFLTYSEINSLEKNDTVVKDENVTNTSYDSHLLNMPLWSLTKEKVQTQEHEIAILEKKIETLKGKTEKQLWTEDLDAFSIKYDQVYNSDISDMNS